MASRKDQLHSYQFLLQRVVSALVTRETDPAQAPLRRGVGAVVVGIMIAIIVAVGAGVYGLLTKSGTDDWRSDHAVLIEKETGATFVYRAGRVPTLTPTLNYTSALLLSAQSPPTAFQVSRASLTGIRRDLTRGIVGVPSTLPAADHTTAIPWSLCAAPTTDEAGNRITGTELAVGRSLSRGHALGDDALLAQDSSTGEIDLIWHSHRYPIASPDTVLSSLFGSQRQILPVGTAWLNGLPSGEDIGPIHIPGRGKQSAKVPGRRIGTLLFDRVGSGTQQFYLVLDGGLSAITALQRDILIGQSVGSPEEVSTGEINQAVQTAPLSPPTSAATQAPAIVPQLVAGVSADSTACAEYTGYRTPPRVLIATGTALPPGIATGSRNLLGTSLADEIAVPAGRIAVVEAMASPDATGGAISIVTDEGVRFPVPSVQVLATLGYSAAEAVRMPVNLVNRIPVGPTLSPDAAAVPAEGRLTGR